jgi:ketosteroid isomerase-like protein
MRKLSSWVLLLMVVCGLGAGTRAASAQREEPAAEAIFAMINKSAADWNRGDIDAFAKSYKNAPDIVFMGERISHGFAQMLSHYKEAYPTPEKMGQLSFTHLEVQPLDMAFATVTGRFHLDRTVAAGGNADGYFMLVVEDTSTGWKIVRDDTTPLPKLGPK